LTIGPAADIVPMSSNHGERAMSLGANRIASLAVTLLALITSPGSAQAPDPAAVRAAMARLDFMVGRWRGQAWQQRLDERVETGMIEVVERRLGGTVLLVEGRGTVPVPGGEDRVVHHALGVISYDPSTRAYTLRSYLSTGQMGDFALTLVEGGVSWSREVPGGRIRNTARYTADEWHEIGEFSRDGTTWTRVMELRLKREP
jgi:hypothetical protein